MPKSSDISSFGRWKQFQKNTIVEGKPESGSNTSWPSKTGLYKIVITPCGFDIHKINIKSCYKSGCRYGKKCKKICGCYYYEQY